MRRKASSAILLFAALLFLLFSTERMPTYADVIIGTSGDDTIVVTPETDCDGIDSDGGNDTIIVEENAEVSREVTESGSATEDADATAIDAGTDDDTVQNNGTVDAEAEAGAASDGENSTASARAAGIDGGAGGDEINNEGDANASATSNATALGASLTIDGTVTGDAGGAALSEAGATAEAAATGIDGNSGADAITNDSSSISADVTAIATTVDVGATIAVTSDGNVSGASLSDTSAAALGTATGIDGSAGADVIANEGDIGLVAVSEAIAAGVDLTIAGSVEGDADGTALSDARGTAASGAVGIGGADGDDTITNTANILAGVNATATAVDVGAEITVAEGGATSGSSLNDTSVTANAAAIGIDGGGWAATRSRTRAISIFWQTRRQRVCQFPSQSTARRKAPLRGQR